MDGENLKPKKAHPSMIKNKKQKYSSRLRGVNEAKAMGFYKKNTNIYNFKI